MISVGILGGHSLRHNMITVLSNLGKMLNGAVDLHLITGVETVQESLKGFYKIHRIRSRFRDPYDLAYAIKGIRSYQRKHKPNILMNVSHPFPLGVAVATLGHLYDIPTAVRMTGDPFSERFIYRSPIVRLKKWIVHDYISVRAYKKATCILPVGRRIKAVLLQKGIPSEKIKVLPQPFDSRLFKAVGKREKSELKYNLKLASGRKVVLFVGSLTWGKGADRLREIITLVARESDKFQFCIVGEGNKRKLFDTFPSSLVNVVGAVSRDRIAKYFQASDLLIHPTRRDGLPNVILEAMACNIPVVASPVCEIPLYVSNLCETVDEYVRFIIKDNYYIDRLPDYFDWEKQRIEYLNTFSRIAEKTVVSYLNTRDQY